MTQISREHESRIIDLVYSHNCLWDPKNPDHSNRNKKWIILQQIADDLNRCFPDNTGAVITAKDVFTKWANMRAYYLCILTRQKSTPSRSETPHEVSWTHFQRMGFLADSTKADASKSNLETPVKAQPFVQSQDVMQESTKENIDSNLLSEDIITTIEDPFSKSNENVTIDIDMCRDVRNVVIDSQQAGTSSNCILQPLPLQGEMLPTLFTPCRQGISGRTKKEPSSVDKRSLANFDIDHDLASITGILHEAGKKITCGLSEAGQPSCRYLRSAQYILEEVFEDLPTKKLKLEGFFNITKAIVEAGKLTLSTQSDD